MKKCWLAAESQRCDDLLVTFFGFPLNEVEKLPALCHELQQAAAGRVVLDMKSQVAGEVGNALSHQGNLVFGTAGIGGVLFVIS